ncbi:MAG: cobalamin biosynthesis protein CobD [Deltaproteobacteria bacterium]|nr:cobalamin biosynthesis protein CobD [Deltaproteobacteria bacterium]
MPFLNPSAPYTISVVIIFAYTLDLISGDPRWLPHPVRWIGRYIVFLENMIRKFAGNPLAEKIGGVFLFVIVVGTVYSLAWLLLFLATRYSPLVTLILAVFIAYTTLSIKSLHQEAYGVIWEIEKISPPPNPPPQGGRAREGGHLDEARNRLKNIVGRDTQNLSEDEIYRAVVETVAENTSDGIIAPLFYLAIGGPALALAYKAVNTLDSMVGYKNGAYKNLGWFSARMDDIANFIPARITALFMAIASFILRLNLRNSLRIVWRDARNHPSPNAGYPEAAVAGALGIQLGGTNYYFGAPHNRPLIGDKNKEFTIESAKDTVKIMRLTAFLGVVLFSGLLLIVSSYIW